MHRMTVFCISRKYPSKMARYASDTLEFYRRTVLDGLNMGCSVPTIQTGRSRPKGCMFMVKKTDFGPSIIQMGKWRREGTTRMARRGAIGSSGVAMARRKKARTTPVQTDQRQLPGNFLVKEVAVRVEGGWMLRKKKER